jgi:nucleoprotein TPR
VLQPSSRKRLISSSQIIDNTSSGEANEANPPLKRPKEEESSELKNGQPLIGDVAVAQIPSTDDQEGQSTEEMDTDQASAPIEEAEASKEDDIGDEDDRDAHVDASIHMKSQDTDVDTDNNATPVEDALAKSEVAVQLFDENQKFNDLKDEAQLTAATNVDDEIEEGELPGEPEQALEIIALEAHRQPSDTGEQAGNVFSAASPGEPTEKNDSDMSEIGGGDTTTERAAAESDQFLIAPSGGADASPSRTTDASPVREPSPNPAQSSASVEQQNTSTVTGGREPSPIRAQAAGSSEQQSSRTINLNQRAIVNRQARIQRTQQIARGRGQQSPQRVWFGHHSCLFLMLHYSD